MIFKFLYRVVRYNHCVDILYRSVKSNGHEIHFKDLLHKCKYLLYFFISQNMKILFMTSMFLQDLTWLLRKTKMETKMGETNIKGIIFLSVDSTYTEISCGTSCQTFYSFALFFLQYDYPMYLEMASWFLVFFSHS